MPAPRETARWVLPARSIMAVAAATLFLAPWLWVVATPVSLLVSQHEFIGYRFFTSLAVLAGESRHVDIVQGVPMGILQHVIVEALTRVLGRPPTEISTLEAFAQASLALAYLPGAGILAATWLAPRFTLPDRLLVTLVALVPWFAWPPAPLLLAPDYWPFELLYGLASTVWAVSLLRGDPAPHPVGVSGAIVAGAWIAVGATLKVSAAAIGALPLVVHLALCDERARLQVRRCLVAAATALAGSILIVWIYFLGDWQTTARAVRTFARFIRQPGGIDFTSLSQTVADPSTGFLRWSLLATVLAGLLAVTGPTIPGRMRVRLLVGGFVALSLAGHVMTLYKRPSSTTAMDFALYGLLVIPVIAAISRTGHRDARFLLCLTPLMVLSVTGRYWDFPAKYPVAAYASARDVIQQVQAYVRDSDRPAVLFAPSSHHLGQVIEQLVLIQGRLGRTPLTPGSLRERVLPRSELLGNSADELARLQDRIAQGWLIIWAHQDPLVPTEHAFPALQRLLDDPRATVRSWDHQAISAGTTIYVGFLAIHKSATTTRCNLCSAAFLYAPCPPHSGA
jgi:hypothetical protein